MRFVDAATTARHLPFAALIAALRRAFTAGCGAPLRLDLIDTAEQVYDALTPLC